MKSKDLVIGKKYKDLENKRCRVIYRGKIKNNRVFAGHHNFASVSGSGGFVCTDKELDECVGELT